MYMYIYNVHVPMLHVHLVSINIQETAINVGFSSRLINDKMDLIKINASSLVHCIYMYVCVIYTIMYTCMYSTHHGKVSVPFAKMSSNKIGTQTVQ